MALTSVNLAARAASYREILGEQLAGKPTGKSFQILFSHVLWSVLFSTTDLYRGSRWELPCVWHWARTPSRLPLSYIGITAPKQVLPPCLWVSQRPASREPLAVGTQLTSSFTLAAGDCSLALLFTWLLRPFSKSSKDLSFSASSS